jgi:hypothetical protein
MGRGPKGPLHLYGSHLLAQASQAFSFSASQITAKLEISTSKSPISFFAALLLYASTPTLKLIGYAGSYSLHLAVVLSHPGPPVGWRVIEGSELGILHGLALLVGDALTDDAGAGPDQRTPDANAIAATT